MTLAIILAAGMGTRLGSYTADLPKCMLPFLGKPLVERQVATLRSAGITDIAIIRGYHYEKISLEGVHYFYAPEYATTNMVETLMQARDRLLQEKESVLVCYGDIIYEQRLVQEILASQAPVNVLVDSAWLEYWKARSDSWREDVESVQFDAQGKVFEIGTPRGSVAQCHARYIGLLRFSPEGIRAFIEAYDQNRARYWSLDESWRRSKSFKKAYMTCMLQELIDRHVDVRVVGVSHGWMEFDTVEDYEKALRWYQEGTLDRFIKIGGGEIGI